jgi:hypothetical protein
MYYIKSPGGLILQGVALETEEVAPLENLGFEVREVTWDEGPLIHQDMKRGLLDYLISVWSEPE